MNTILRTLFLASSLFLAAGTASAQSSTPDVVSMTAAQRAALSTADLQSYTVALIGEITTLRDNAQNSTLTGANVNDTRYQALSAVLAAVVNAQTLMNAHIANNASGEAHTVFEAIVSATSMARGIAASPSALQSTTNSPGLSVSDLFDDLPQATPFSPITPARLND